MVNQIPFRTSKSETSGAGPATPNHPSPPSLLPLRFHTLTNPSMRKPFVFTSMQTPGVSPKEFDSIARVRSVALPQIHSFHAVAASCGLLALFFAFVSFIFNHLQPLVPKTGGGVGGAGRASVRPFQITYSGVKTLEREQGITR